MKSGKDSQKLRRAREWTDGDQRVLDRANRISLTGEEIMEFVEAVQSQPKQQRSYEARVGIACKLHPENHDKVFALMTRTEALARLLDKEGVPGWAIRVDNKRILTDEVVFNVAAVEPLIPKDAEGAFDREAFLKRALELAEVERIG